MKDIDCYKIKKINIPGVAGQRIFLVGNTVC